MTVKIRNFCRLLVWEAPILRFMIFLFFGQLVSQLLLIFVLSEELKSLGVVQGAVYASVFTLLLFFDFYYLQVSHNKWQESFLTAVSGEVANARQLFDHIIKLQFKPPLRLYYLRYAELLYMEGEDRRAQIKLDLALESGASKDQCDLSKIRGMLFSESGADSEMESINLVDCGSLVPLESAMFNLFRLNNYKKANEQLKLALFLQPELHPSLMYSYDLSNLLKLCLALHTGKAEQALRPLSSLLDYLKLSLSAMPEVRPYLSFAYLERAKYFSRRPKTKNKSREDIDLALAICRYPAHLLVASSIK